MKLSSPKRSRLHAILAAAAVITLTQALTAQNTDGFQSLFNGKDLTGWKAATPNPFWTVSHGILVGQNNDQLKGNVLYTEKSYKDFVIDLETRWNGEIDSGVMLRKPELQLQFGVSRSLKKDMTCSFYTGGQEKYPVAGQAKDLEKVLKAGDWNRVRLEAKGDAFTVWLNGQKVTEYKTSAYPGAAPLGLQVHPGLKMKVEFRNIQLKSLD